MNSKNIVIGVLLLVLIGAVIFLLVNKSEDNVVVVEQPETEEMIPVEPDGGIGDGAEPLIEVETVERGSESILGTSVGGKEITAYHLGEGETEVLLIGGTHGSYSQNTSALANEALDYFQSNTDAIPKNVTLTIIPTLNPDGLAMTGTEGRFNGNNVDLNRNFDCEWSAEGVWRDQKVSGGSEAFSEPEAAALQNYVNTYSPNAAIVLFSAEGKVYPSACGGTPKNASVQLADTYATAAGYPAASTFDAYAITGDMVNWMAQEGIPAISVLLSDHANTEWNKNKAGIEAVLKAYSE
jgi:hypothetical protein